MNDEYLTSAKPKGEPAEPPPQPPLADAGGPPQDRGDPRDRPRFRPVRPRNLCAI